MMTQSNVDEAVELLIAAEMQHKQIAQLSKKWPDISIDDAYTIQRRVAKSKLASGAKLIGHKIGLTSKAMQQSSMIDEPDYGHLLDHMVVPNGSRLPRSNYCSPRVEAELAFVLRSRVRGPGVGLLDALRATEYVVPALEIIDARIESPRKIFDTVADNASAAGVVLGGRPIDPREADLRWIGTIMYRNSEIEETGLAAGVLGHPAAGIAWLANKLAGFDESLEAGQVVLSGSFVRPIWANEGDTVFADFGNLGTVSVQFVGLRPSAH